jgi:Skp family chaperone for outer membrane proteins
MKNATTLYINMPFTLNLEDLPQEARKYGTVEVLFQEYEKYKEVCEEYETKIRQVSKDMEKMEEIIKQQDEQITELTKSMEFIKTAKRKYEEKIIEQDKQIEILYIEKKIRDLLLNDYEEEKINKKLEELKCMLENSY